MHLAASGIHPLEQMLSVVGPIVGAIVFLTLFFKLIGWLSARSAVKRLPFKGVLDELTVATVHLVGGATIENVRVIGFTDPSSAKDMLPYELRGMVILEHADGRRMLIQAKTVRMIEVPATVRSTRP